MVDRRTVSSAHDRIDVLDRQMVEVSTTLKIQLKDIYGRMKVITSIIIGASGAIILMLATVITKLS